MARPRRQSSFQGARLRSARLERNLSQAQLAEGINVHRATLIRWESDLSAPTPEQEETIARALSRPVQWFREPPPSPQLYAEETALSTDEKVEVLLNRVGRVEKRLDYVVQLLERLAEASAQPKP